MTVAKDERLESGNGLFYPSNVTDGIQLGNNDYRLVTGLNSSPLEILSANGIVPKAYSLNLGNMLITTQDAIKPLYSSEYTLSVKPTVEEEVSKIHEELANLNQSNNELRKERKELDKIIQQLAKEKEQLKGKLKKERMKTKSQRESIEVQEIELNDQQSQIDNLERRMNDAETVLHIKEAGI